MQIESGQLSNDVILSNMIVKKNTVKLQGKKIGDEPGSDLNEFNFCNTDDDTSSSKNFEI